MMNPIGPTTGALVLLTVALWGGTPVAIRYSVDVLPPVAVSGLRFALAALFMLAWCRFSGGGLRLRRGQFVPSLVLGVLLFAQIALFAAGIQFSTASHGSLFINTFVFWVVVIEHFATRSDRLTVVRFVGLLLAAGGVVLLLSTREPTQIPNAASSPRDEPTLTGDLMLLGSGLLLAIKLIYTKRATLIVEPGKLIFWHDVFGVVLFAVYSAIFETVDVSALIDFDRPGTVPALLGIAYQGIVIAGFCFAVQARLLQRHSAVQLSVFSFLTPVFGIALGVLFRGDSLSPWLFASAMLVTVGIILVNRKASRRGRNTPGAAKPTP